MEKTLQLVRTDSPHAITFTWLTAALSGMLDHLPILGTRRRLRRRGATSLDASVF